ncbi:DUF1538 domain-containing protein [Nitrospina watsonii]|uniref:Na(+), Li(+), K(+)/H(+) antiporter subunit A n=1 Tax=Nitrospina watsonii TaxID=1323948 RepID=A0ABM9HE14_9BACT|nr:DUF1538 domain-containing protein [Nitrospina watsonii]CAI2718344.1 Na(+), Li(+), K(+)/H(+) antiporter subunit A [Nitrospina watsonii]
MGDSFRYLSSRIFSACLDVLPILLVISFFQIVVIQKPFPNLTETLFGFALVVTGLFFFVQGLEIALFPIGERIANQFALKGNPWWILLFGFMLGFATTIAEPALTVIANKAGEMIARAGAIPDQPGEVTRFVLGLRLTIALSVGFAGAMGVLRILKGWPLVTFILIGYALIVIMTAFAPHSIIGIAYDAGGITTSTLTVPLITALGVGLATSIRGRNPIIDGFGMIALASLTPILFVMIYGSLYMS